MVGHLLVTSTGVLPTYAFLFFIHFILKSFKVTAQLCI